MADWSPGTEQEKAAANVTECGLQLWRAEENARRVAETLRRAIRGVEAAEHALTDAKRRLDRTESPIARVGRDDSIHRLALLR